MTNKRKHPKEISKDNPGVVGGFFGLDPFEAAISASRFDIQEEVETLIRLVRDPDPKVSLPALKQFRAILKEVAGANGFFGSLEQTKRTNNSEEFVEQKVQTNVLLTNLRRDNEKDEEKVSYEVHKPIDHKDVED